MFVSLAFEINPLINNGRKTKTCMIKPSCKKQTKQANTNKESYLQNFAGGLNSL